jgi:hypothetical protein
LASLSREKHSSLFIRSISNEEKSVITLITGFNVLKLFYSLTGKEAKEAGTFVKGEPFRPCLAKH